MKRRASELSGIYATLLEAFGPQDWWPGDGPLEVIVGAVLTQNTSWSNVELALGNLREADALSVEALGAMSPADLEELIRPAGFFRRKARTIAELVDLCRRAPGGLDGLLALPLHELREALLAVTGVGAETADSIALYAAGHATFVVDAYTRRFAERHGFARLGTSDDELKALFEAGLPGDLSALNECHALLVRLGKEHCRPTPKCDECPLRGDLRQNGTRPAGGRTAALAGGSPENGLESGE